MVSATPNRMLASALARIHDAKVLGETGRAEADSSALLTILGFEILLKCSLRLSGAPVMKSHNYFKLWKALPDAAVVEILDVAKNRMPGYADLSDIEKLLNGYQYIFEKARYPYEPFEGYTIDEERELGEYWISLGAPIDEALVQYHPMELACLIAGLQAYVERHVP
jgi:hypothetical protein